jgi:hypothetical protein
MFSDWLQRFLAYASTHEAALGLTETDLDTLVAIKPIWEGKLAAHVSAQTTARGARAMKDETRSDAEAIVRPLVARIQTYSGTTDADRAALGITIRSTAMVPTGETDGDRPVGFIDINQRAKHVLRVENSTEMGASKAKPSWAFGCEVWCKIGEPPASDGSDLQYVGVMTRNPHTVTHGAEDVGKTVHYMLRWVDKKGTPGHWSETQSATIAA